MAARGLTIAPARLLRHRSEWTLRRDVEALVETAWSVLGAASWPLWTFEPRLSAAGLVGTAAALLVPSWLRRRAARGSGLAARWTVGWTLAALVTLGATAQGLALGDAGGLDGDWAPSRADRYLLAAGAAVGGLLLGAAVVALQTRRGSQPSHRTQRLLTIVSVVLALSAYLAFGQRVRNRQPSWDNDPSPGDFGEP